MARWLIIPVLLAALGDPACAEQPKPDPAKVLADLVRLYNEGPAKELHGLLSSPFQEKLPLAKLEETIRQVRSKYGKINDPPTLLREDGSWRSYRARGDKLPVVLKVAVDADGHISGFQFLPPFRFDLPAGPLTLEEVQRRLRDAVEQTLYTHRVPSISLALVQDDRIVWARAFGYLNVAKAVPADADTVYVTGSIFKVVVATALMQFVDEGKLDLDAPVNGYLKDFQVPNPFEKEVPLTMRHLLSHHGGVPNGARWVDLWKRELPTPLEELLRKQVKVTTKPGEKFAYSNLGFTLNGYLVGKLAETSFEEAMKKRLLGPLEMTHTEFAPTPQMTENLALPYQSSSDGKAVVPAPRVRFDVYPAGDVYSTPSDMAHFLILHLNGGKYNGKQVVSAKAIEEMARLQFAKKDETSGIGLGWLVRGVPSRRLLTHNGAVPGFFTYMLAEPDKRLGVVLFCNKFNPLEAALGVFNDPLGDLADLAAELLERLERPKSSSKQ